MNGEIQPYLFTYLEVVNDRVPHGGAYNMALDEVLLQGTLELPLLRLYRWADPAVSFGYFERWQPVAASFPKRELVRRWTGGGMVEHGSDWTYSLLLPRTVPLTNLPAGESYRLIHAGLQQALNEVGMTDVTLLPAANNLASGDLRACFAKPVPHDLMLNGIKISGAAQRRTRRAWLHQGSVQQTGVENGVVDQLNNVLPSVLARKWTTRVPSQAEEAAANDLATRKYATGEWLCRV